MMTMVQEVSAPELDANPFPRVPGLTHLSLGLAVRKPGGHTLDDITELARNHAEQKHHALLVDRRVLQAAKIQESPVLAATSRWRRGHGRTCCIWPMIQSHTPPLVDGQPGQIGKPGRVGHRPLPECLEHVGPLPPAFGVYGVAVAAELLELRPRRDRAGLIERSSMARNKSSSSIRDVLVGLKPAEATRSFHDSKNPST
jgi:hypothetical protein